VFVTVQVLAGCQKNQRATQDNLQDASQQTNIGDAYSDVEVFETSTEILPNMSSFSIGRGWHCTAPFNQKPSACHPTEQACRTRYGQLNFICSLGRDTPIYNEWCTRSQIQLNNESCSRVVASAFCFTATDETSSSHRVIYSCTQTMENCNLFRNHNINENFNSSSGRIVFGNISLCRELH